QQRQRIHHAHHVIPTEAASPTLAASSSSTTPKPCPGRVLLISTTSKSAATHPTERLHPITVHHRFPPLCNTSQYLPQYFPNTSRILPEYFPQHSRNTFQHVSSTFPARFQHVSSTLAHIRA